MKVGIGARLGLLASVLIIGTVFILGWWMLGWSRGALTRHEQLALADETMLRGGELLRAAQGLREDALRQAGRTPLQEYLRAPAGRQTALKDQVEHDFAALLDARKPRYLQIEYLPPDAGGLPAIKAARDSQDVH